MVVKRPSDTTMAFRVLKGDVCLHCGYWQGKRQMFYGVYLDKYKGLLCSKCVLSRSAITSLNEFTFEG